VVSEKNTECTVAMYYTQTIFFIKHTHARFVRNSQIYSNNGSHFTSAYISLSPPLSLTSVPVKKGCIQLLWKCQTSVGSCKYTDKFQPGLEYSQEINHIKP